MHRFVKTKKIISTMALAASIGVFFFVASAPPARALFGVGDISITAGDIPRQIANIFNRIRQGAGSRAWHQAIRSVSYKFAQDTAVWIASGGRGRKPLIFTKSPKAAFKEIGDQIAGKALVNLAAGLPINFCSSADLKSRLNIIEGISKSVQDFDIFDYDRISNPVSGFDPFDPVNTDTGRTGCKLSDIGKNFSAVKDQFNQGDILVKLQEGFSKGQSDLSTILHLTEAVKKEKQREEESQKIERTSATDVKPVTDPTGQNVVTSKSQVEEVQKSGIAKSLLPDPQITGDIFVDTFAIFANTLARTYLKRLQSGFYPFSQSRSPDSLFAGFGEASGSRGALLSSYDSFSSAQALSITSGEIDLFAEMSSCPTALYQTPYNCALNEAMQDAVQNGYTVQKAIKDGNLGNIRSFPQDHQDHKDGEPNLSIENLKKLRFLRVIPVGWEIAAERLKGRAMPFDEVVKCFEDPDDKSNPLKPYGCPRLDANESPSDNPLSINALYHLVDPQWVLSIPNQYCKANGFGNFPEHESSPNRSEVCVDLQSCIAEDDAGNCEQYGYCTRERVVFSLAGRACEPQNATCTTLTSANGGEKISVLGAYVDKNGCGPDSNGCAWYSAQKNASENPEDQTDDWVKNKKIYLNANSESCDPKDVGAREIIPLEAGINLVRNGNFTESLFAAKYREGGNAKVLPPGDEGGWVFTGSAPFDDENNPKGSIYLKRGSSEEAISVPVAPSSARQGISVKPNTYYTLSVNIKSNAANTGASVGISTDSNDIRNIFGTTLSNANIRNVSFPPYNTLESGTEFSLSFASGNVPQNYQRYAATFYNSSSSFVVIILEGAIFDDVQLEEVRLNDGAKAQNTVKDYVEKNSNASDSEKIESLNNITTSNPASAPHTVFVPYESAKPIVFGGADVCGDADLYPYGDPAETSARRYTPTAGGLAKIASLLPSGLCPKECNGFDEFLKPLTAIEKLAAPNTVSARESFAPQYAQSCSAQSSGCEVFTNLSPEAQERREYYNRIESCVLDTNPGISTFYTWEGTDTAGFQLKVWQLLQDENSKGPCANYVQGQIRNPDTEQCDDPAGGSPSCSLQPESNDYSPTCRVFLDEEGNEHRRDTNLIVTASNECAAFRRTNGATQESWYFIPREANQCAPSAVGCREYKGVNANLVTNLFKSDFEGGVDSWIGGEKSPESRNTGEASYKVSQAPNVILRSVSSEILSSSTKTFKLKFLAKGEGNAAINKIFLNVGTGLSSQDSNYDPKADYDDNQIIDLTDFQNFLRLFTKPSDKESKFDFDGNGVIDFADFIKFSSLYGIGYKEQTIEDSPKALTGDWQPYEFGPIDLSGSSAPEYILGLSMSGTVFIDDIELMAVASQYYIADSWQRSQPASCTTGEFDQCHEYKDDKNNTYYISRFDGGFSEKALDCTAVIDTHNYSYPYSETFNKGDDSEYSVPADTLSYLYINKDNKLSSTAAGCAELGRPEIDSSNNVKNWASVYKKIDPDKFVGAGGAMCLKEALRCELFKDSFGGNQVLRNPGNKLCQWDASINKGVGGFVKADSPTEECPVCVWDSAQGDYINQSTQQPCAPDEAGFVPKCEADQNSCTAYSPMGDNLSEGAQTVSYLLANTVSQGNCEAENADLGCINFDVEYYNQDKPSSPYLLGGAPKNRLTSSLPDTQVMEVEQVRQCAEWLEPTTSSEVFDPQKRTSRVVSYELGRCQQLNSSGQCVKWVETSDPAYPNVYISSEKKLQPFNADKYQDRYAGSETIFSGAWDYSGYSIPGQYPVDLMRESIGDNPKLIVNIDKDNTNIPVKIAGGGVGDNEDSTLSCRSYPEADSPFGRGSIGERMPNYQASLDFSGESVLRDLNLCEEQGIGCECSYKKVESLATPTIYLPPESISPLPSDTRTVSNINGWQGYCLEKNTENRNPNNEYACLAWWPVDVAQAADNIFDNHPAAGFITSAPLYYCAEAKGNKLDKPYEGLYYKEADQNTYLVTVGAEDSNHDNRVLSYVENFRTLEADNKEAAVTPFRFADKKYKGNFSLKYALAGWLITAPLGPTNLVVRGIGALVGSFLKGGTIRYGPENETGLLKFPVWPAPSPDRIDNKLPSSFLGGLHEYEIEEIVFISRDRQYSDWPGAGEQMVLSRQGFAKSPYASPKSNERWSAFWCGGGNEANCDLGEYRWDEFKFYVGGNRCDSDSADTIDPNGKTNLLAIRARFADKNGSGGDYMGGTLEPYQFLGFEGGLCDNTDKEGWVEFQIAFRLREWCTTVALVNDLGDNKAWSGRLNSNPQPGSLSGRCVPNGTTYGTAPTAVPASASSPATDFNACQDDCGDLLDCEQVNQAYGSEDPNNLSISDCRDTCDLAPSDTEYNSSGYCTLNPEKCDSYEKCDLCTLSYNSCLNSKPTPSTFYASYNLCNRCLAEQASSSEAALPEDPGIEPGVGLVGSFCNINANCAEGNYCYYEYEAEGIKGYITGFYNATSTPDESRLLYDADNSPFGALVAPPETLFNPEEWDSRADTEIVQVTDNNRIVEEERDLEPGKQPLYVEANRGQIRAGTPLSCSAGNVCTFPPTKNGKDLTYSGGVGAGIAYLRQLFGKVYKTWIWNANRSQYEESDNIGFDLDFLQTGNMGECPVMQAAKYNTAKEIFEPVESRKNEPMRGVDCPERPLNAGHYSIDGRPVELVNNFVKNPTVNVGVGDEVRLQFYGYNYNGEQLPIREIKIDWDSDNIDDTIISGNFKNHRSDCNSSGPNWGQKDAACDPNIFEFIHVYQSFGSYIPRVTIIDNWGRKTQSNYQASESNRDGGIIEVEEQDGAIGKVANFNVSPEAPNSGSRVIFSWGLPTEFTGNYNSSQIADYKVKIKKVYLSTPIESYNRSDIASNFPVEYTQVNGEALIRVVAQVQACTKSTCGQVATKQATYKPSLPDKFFIGPNSSRVQWSGVPYNSDQDEILYYAWKDNRDAEKYEIELKKYYFNGSASQTSLASINQKTAEQGSGYGFPAYRYRIPYEPGVNAIEAKIRACNGDVCTQFSSPPVRAEYTITNLQRPIINVVASHNFGNVPVNTSATFDLTISNLGQAGLSINGISTSDNKFSASRTNFSIDPKSSGQTTITFLPAAEGLATANLVITSNDPNTPSVTVRLTGTGTPALQSPPNIQLSQTNHDFGDAQINTSRTFDLTISNSGQQNLSVTSISSSNSKFTVSAPTANIVPGSSQTVRITFSPTVVASESSVLTIASNDPDSPSSTVSLNGRGTAIPAAQPNIQISETNHDFGDVETNTSRTFDLVISNSGGGILQVSSISSSDSQFTPGNNGFSTGPGINNHVIITFTPTSSGRKTSNLVIASNDPDNSSLTVSLSGNGTAPPPSPAEFSINPDSYNFGNVDQGSPATHGFIVSNAGGSDLSITGINFNQPKFTTSTNVPLTVPPGQQRTINVIFTSGSDSGLNTGTMTIKYNNGISRFVFAVSLEATGVAQPVTAPEINVFPGSISFGWVQLGSSADRTFTISNSGTANLTGTINFLTFGSAAGFSYSILNDYSYTVAPGQELVVTITFQPVSQYSYYNGSATITSNDSDEGSISVAISGLKG